MPLVILHWHIKSTQDILDNHFVENMDLTVTWHADRHQYFLQDTLSSTEVSAYQASLQMVLMATMIHDEQKKHSSEDSDLWPWPWQQPRHHDSYITVSVLIHWHTTAKTKRFNSSEDKGKTVWTLWHWVLTFKMQAKQFHKTVHLVMIHDL